jgi:arabinofuranosyltransferase
MLGSLFAFYQKYFSIIFIFTIVLLTAFAWSQRFIQDDAFISFRYAHNFISGEGLVWNANERVEGYTNFLWTMLISGGMISGIDPITGAYLFGLTFFVISIITTYKTAQLIFGTRDISFIVMLLLGLNYTFFSYATGGLETQMQTALVILSFYFTMKITVSPVIQQKHFFVTSILFSLAVLTRLDSGIIILSLMIFIAIKVFAHNLPLQLKFRYLFILAAPMLIIVGSWLMWKLSYYGNILPNTFYVIEICFNIFLQLSAISNSNHIDFCRKSDFQK